MTARLCRDCTSPISRTSKGRCRPCSAHFLNTDPEMVTRRAAAQQAYFALPGVREAHAARLAHHLANMSDQERERRREHGRRIAATILHSPEARARANHAEVKARAGRSRTNTTLADIPPAYRDRYRFLKDVKLIRAAEARALIAAEVAADERTRLAAMTPFERQLERVRNGAPLITVQPRRSIEPAITLGGVATGML